MKITKIGHCCLLIQYKNVSIITDPGNLSFIPKDIKEIELILITHEHADHLHLESLKEILSTNSRARIITNSSVGKILDSQGISYTLVSDKEKFNYKDIEIVGFGKNHASIYTTIPSVENTGYLIDDKLFYPGDSLYNPKRKIEILALPVAGPWLKLSEAIDYARLINPRRCFPVHDGIMKINTPFHNLTQKILHYYDIEFHPMVENDIWDVN